MAKYVMTWRVYHSATVEADSESAARQAWIDGSYDDEEEGEQNLLDVEEVET